MDQPAGWRRVALSRGGILGSSLALAAALLLLGWADYRTTRRELLSLVETHATALRETIAAATRTNAAASAFAEAQISARVRDNARLLASLDRERPLDAAVIDAIARRNELFRVMVYDRAGTRELGSVAEASAARGRGAGGPAAGSGRGAGGGPGGGPGGGSGAGAGQGPGPGAAGLVARILEGTEEEIVGDVHAGRRGGAARLAAAVRRPRGGVILVNADASAILALQRQSSLDALLTEVVQHATDVAYVAVDVGGTRRSAGVLPSDLVTSQVPDGGSRQIDVEGRPVLEFTGRVSKQGDADTLVRVGMRLDDVRRVERRFLVRQAMSLLVALLLGGLGLGLVWLRSQYGSLADAHAKAREALERRDRLAAMGELASTVAHEIRNPLNAIAMSAQRLRREAFGGEQADPDNLALVDVIRRESNRINDRVQQFLAFARPPTLNPTRAALGPWLQAIVEAVRASASVRDVAIELDVSGAADAAIDPEQLRQAVDNLLRNAIEATPSGMPIAVRGVSARDGHRIVVRDSGPGIAADVLPKIFDLYYTTKHDGTGVGLAISQQIVSAHGGRIEVATDLGYGTTFTIVLPATS